MVNYRVHCTDLYGEYGISAFENEQTIICIERITNNRIDMEQLADMCNELELELCHLNDVIEDYLTDFRIG